MYQKRKIRLGKKVFWYKSRWNPVIEYVASVLRSYQSRLLQVIYNWPIIDKLQLSNFYIESKSLIHRDGVYYSLNALNTSIECGLLLYYIFRQFLMFHILHIPFDLHSGLSSMPKFLEYLNACFLFHHLISFL